MTWQGVGFLTPDNPEGSGETCRSFFVPNRSDWLALLMGAMQALTEEGNWQQFGTYTPEQTAAKFQQIWLQALTSEGCAGSDTTACIYDLFYDEDTDLVMWWPPSADAPVENPYADPRHGVIYRLPPVVADDPKCQAAANMTRYISNLIDATLENIAAGSTVAGAVLALLPLLVELGPFAILIALLGALVGELFAAGAIAIEAAFTNETFDTLTCIFYCNIEADGSVTAADLTEIETQISAQIGGLAATILNLMFGLMGEVGLSNAGVSGDAPADCSGCDCAGTWERQFNFCGTADSWTIHCGQQEANGIQEVDSCEGQPSIVWIQRNIALPVGSTITQVEFWVEGEGGGLLVLKVYWNGVEIYNDSPMGIHPFDLVGQSLTGTADMLILVDSNVTGGTRRIPTLRLFGTGTAPAIGHAPSDPPCLE